MAGNRDNCGLWPSQGVVGSGLWYRSPSYQTGVDELGAGIPGAAFTNPAMMNFVGPSKTVRSINEGTYG